MRFIFEFDKNNIQTSLINSKNSIPINCILINRFEQRKPLIQKLKKITGIIKKSEKGDEKRHNQLGRGSDKKEKQPGRGSDMIEDHPGRGESEEAGVIRERKSEEAEIQRAR